MNSIVVATYNIHSAVGFDRRYAPDRIATVIEELGADVIALQEVQSKPDFDLLDFLARKTGYTAIAGTTMQVRDGDFGNAVLTRFPVLSSERVSLEVAEREPRAAIDATLDIDGTTLRVIATHLGLSPRERTSQIETLLAYLDSKSTTPTILLGDMNEWFVRSAALRRLHDRFGESPARATYPSLFPLIALDRVWCSRPLMTDDVRVHRSRVAKTASDHLPLIATICCSATNYSQK